MLKESLKDSKIPMNLQTFAEGGNPVPDNPDGGLPTGGDPAPDGEGNGESGEGSGEGEPHTPTVEELMAQLAQERAEKEKYKVSLNKASSEAAEYKKKFREKQTAKEQEEEAIREQQEQHAKYVKGIETELATIKATKRYMGLGMPEDMAAETAKAEIEGDSEAVTASMKKFMDKMIKVKEAEWLKSRPPVNAGNGEDGDDKKDPFLAGFNSLQ